MSDDLSFEYKVGRLNLQPDDILVVKIGVKLIDRQHMDRVRAEMQMVTKHHKVLVIDSNVDLSVLTKDEIEAKL